MTASRRGFTVFELLLVLLLLSFFAAFTIRHYFSKAEVTLENAAILLAQDIRAAQHRSVFLREPSLFTFLPDGTGYVVTDSLGVIAHNPLTEEPFLRRYSEDGVFHGVDVVEAIAGSDRTLEIDGRGAPKEDLSVVLGYQKDRRTIVVDHKSGGINVVGSTSGWVDVDS